MAVKENVGELEYKVREVFYRHIMKEFTGVLQGLSVKNRFLVWFQDACEKDMTQNKLTVVTVERITITEEVEFPTIAMIPDDNVDLEKG